MERLGRENEALMAEVAALRARSDGSAEEAVQRAREQLASALSTLDAVLVPKPPCSSSFSSTQHAAVNGCYGSTTEPPASGCCPPPTPLSKSPPTSEQTPREATIHRRPIPPCDIPRRDTPSRLGHPAKDEECCGGLFDCDAMIRTAVGTEPRLPP